MNGIEYNRKNDMTIIIEDVEATNICQFDHKPETIFVSVEYRPDKKLIEVQSFRDYISQNFEAYIEGIAEQVFEDILVAINPKSLKVTVRVEDVKIMPWSVMIEK